MTYHLIQEHEIISLKRTLLRKIESYNVIGAIGGLGFGGESLNSRIGVKTLEDCSAQLASLII